MSRLLFLLVSAVLLTGAKAAEPKIVPIEGYKDFRLGASWKDLSSRYEFARGEDYGTWTLVGDEQVAAGTRTVPFNLTVTVDGDVISRVDLRFETQANSLAEVKQVRDDLAKSMKAKYTQEWTHQDFPPEADDPIQFGSVGDETQDLKGNTLFIMTTYSSGMTGKRTIEISYIRADQVTGAGEL